MKNTSNKFYQGALKKKHFLVIFADSIKNLLERMMGIKKKRFNTSPSLRTVRNRRPETVSLPKYKLK